MAEPLKFSPSVMSWSDWMEQNEVVRNWSVKVKKQLKASAKQFSKGKKAAAVTYGKPPNTRTEYKLSGSLKHRVFYKHGISEGTSFRMQRHGVFRHYGTGRGYKRVGGTVMRVKKKYSIEKQKVFYEQTPGAINRTPADWFNPIIDRNVPLLADQVTRINADAAVNAFRMRIK